MKTPDRPDIYQCQSKIYTELSGYVPAMWPASVISHEPYPCYSDQTYISLYVNTGVRQRYEIEFGYLS